MFEIKNKVCVWGCGASRQSESISISKNKPPPLLIQRVNWSTFIHSHCFYYHSQCLRTKIKFACGCGASRQVGSILFLKIMALSVYYYIWLSEAHIYISIVYYHSQSLSVGVVVVERQEVLHL